MSERSEMTNRTSAAIAAAVVIGTLVYFCVPYLVWGLEGLGRLVGGTLAALGLVLYFCLIWRGIMGDFTQSPKPKPLHEYDYLQTSTKGHNTMSGNEISKGAYRVGTSFNPSGNATVDQIKARAAELIDLIETIPTRPDPQHGPYHQQASDRRVAEVARLKALAQTDIETAAMHAVKAATKRVPGD